MSAIPFRVEPAATAGEALFEYELPSDGRVRLTARAGERRTGGYRIAVTGITRTGALLRVTCEIHEPAGTALVTQVLTSLAQTVSVDEALVRGVRHVVLVDGRGVELARINAQHLT